MPEPTGTPPDEGNEPGADKTPVESPVIPEETPPETPPEMSPEEKRDHDLRSWIGRRDAEIRTEMEKRNQVILEEIRQIRAGEGIPPAETPDPSLDADAWFEHKLRQKETAQKTYYDTLVKTGTTLLQQDELAKNDPELTQEIYQEIQQGRVIIDQTLPAETAAALAIASAKSNVLTRRITKKTNPLAGNVPSDVPKGGIAPPAAPTKPAVKLPEMSDLVKRKAKEWGYSDEVVAEILK